MPGEADGLRHFTDGLAHLPDGVRGNGEPSIADVDDPLRRRMIPKAERDGPVPGSVARVLERAVDRERTVRPRPDGEDPARTSVIEGLLVITAGVAQRLRAPTRIKVRLAVRGGAEPHPAAPEVLHLAEAGLEDFAASGEHAAVEGQGEPVGVSDPVDAGEPVLPEQMVVAEGMTPRVEERQVILIQVGHPQIEESRLDGLDEALLPEVRFVIEVKAAVDAERRNHPGWRLGDVRGHALELVAGVVHGGARDQVAGRGAERKDH